MRFKQPPSIPSEALSVLLPVFRSIFAASCAERVFPAYDLFHETTGLGRPDQLAKIKDELWLDIINNSTCELDGTALYSTCLFLTPSDDDIPWSPGLDEAQYASGSLAYALKCRESGDTQFAVWSAELVLNALYLTTINLNGFDGTTPEGHDQAIHHAYYTDELSKQQQDIDDLSIADTDYGDTVLMIRSRAIRDSAHIRNLIQRRLQLI